MVTDPHAAPELRADAHTLAFAFKAQFGTEGWRCENLPPAAGDPIRIRFVAALSGRGPIHAGSLLRERRIQGSSMGSNHFRVDMPRLVEFYLRGKLHLEDWISAKLSLSEINEGFANMKAGRALRSVVVFDS